MEKVAEEYSNPSINFGVVFCHMLKVNQLIFNGHSLTNQPLNIDFVSSAKMVDFGMTTINNNCD